MQNPNQELKSKKALRMLYDILFKQSQVTPLIFFSFVIIKQFELVSSQYSSYSLFYVGILLFIFSCFNHFLLYSSVLTASIGGLAPYNIAIGLIGSNKKWKLYLFWFVATYYFTNSYANIVQIFIIVNSGYICIQTFREFIFDTVGDNVAYFTGFFTLLFIHLFAYVTQATKTYQFNNIEKACIIPFLSILGYSIINLKIHNIKQCEPTTIKNSSIFIQYINMMRQSVKNEQNIHSYLYIHKQSCLRNNCFCRQVTDAKLLSITSSQVHRLSQQIINSVFIEYFESRNLEHEDRLILFHKYIQYLIQCKQYPRAMIILTQINEQSMSYFNRAQNYRVRAKLQDYLRKFQYFDRNRHKLKHIYQYDLEVGYVLKQLREIMQDKVQFWKQLCRQTPVLKVLEKMGRNLVTKIQDLHQYFMYTIRPSQQILSSFKCTIIYATYLIVSTNYAEFGNSLTKKIQKIKEESKNQLGELGMEYGIFLRISENYQRLAQNSFELIIENISTDLAVVLKEEKQKILFKNVADIIPKEFRDIHSMKFDEYVKNINISEHKSCFIGENNQLPFYAGSGYVIFLNMMAGLRFDPISNSAVVKCILTKMKNEEINFIVDVNGDIIYKQSDQFKEYLQKDQYQQSIQNIRNTLERTGHIQKFETKILGEQNPISIIFQPLYIHQLRQLGQMPLIRVQIKSENLKNQKLKLNNYLIANKVKNIEGKHEIKETDSQTSTSSRKESVQNVLSVLMESSSLKMEVFLSITLLLILVCAIASFLVFSNLFLIWNTQVKQKSPTFIVINLIKLKSLMNTAISWEYDCFRSQKSPAYMASLYSSLYNGTSVTDIGIGKFENILQQQQNIINNYFFGLESEINTYLQQLLTKTLSIKNPIDEYPQNMSLQNILLNYLVDIYTISKSQSYNKTLLSFSYISQFYEQISQITAQLADNLEKKIEILKTNNIISISFISVILLAFIFPIWKFNVSNKKKHERVFSLLASIQSKLILDQIKKLQKIQNMIFVQCNHQKDETTQYNNEKFTTTLHQIQSQPVSQVKIEQESQKKPLNVNKVVEGIKKLAADQLLNSARDKIPFKVRKRAGQIQISGSDCDKTKFRFQDWCVAIFLLLFLALIHGIFWDKIFFINRVGGHFKMSLQQLDKLEDNTNAILNSKIFSDEYTATNQITFLGEDIQKYLRNWIITYKSQSGFSISEEISVQKCSANILACKNLYSQKIFQGLIKKGISDSYQWAKAALDPAHFSNSSHFNNSYVTLEKLRFMLVFSQQLMDLLTTQRFKWSADSFTDLEQAQKNEQKMKTTFLIIFWILILIFCIFTIFYTISIKKSYIKQVSLLSVLNKQMLYNNKRVESFLHKLSRTS